MKFKFSYWFTAVVLLFFVDFIFKYLLIHYYRGGYFFIDVLKNKGIAFGIPITSAAIYFFYFFLVIIMIVLIYLCVRSFISNRRLEAVLFLFIIAGAFSNISDRLFYGAVIDYIDLKVWPVFNIADVMIVIGTGTLLINNIKKNKSA